MNDPTTHDTDALEGHDHESLTMAVAEVLEDHGWQTELPLGLDGDADRVATRDGTTRLVRVVPATSDPLAASAVSSAVETVETADASHVSLVVATDVTDAAREHAEGYDQISLVDVQTVSDLEAWAATLSDPDSVSDATSLEVSSADAVGEESDDDDAATGAATEPDDGRSPNVLAAAVTDDADEEPASLEVQIPDPEHDRAETSDTTDDDVSERIRLTERRGAIAEILLQATLLIGLLVCVVYVALRLGAVLV